MDISETLAPKSDQQNYDDYVTGPKTVTVSGVKVLKGNDQPVHVELAEYPGRPFKPNKSMRRILAKAWGPDSDKWIGRRLTLFGNPDVRYGGKAVGGIEIAAMSHMEGGKPLTVQLTETRGRKKGFTVQPLTEPAPSNQPPTIPDQVRATVARVKGTPGATDYIAWLKDEGAPAHILNYAQHELEEQQ